MRWLVAILAIAVACFSLYTWIVALSLLGLELGFVKLFSRSPVQAWWEFVTFAGAIAGTAGFFWILCRYFDSKNPRKNRPFWY
jgi:hypothetical protein